MSTKPFVVVLAEQEIHAELQSCADLEVFERFYRDYDTFFADVSAGIVPESTPGSVIVVSDWLASTELVNFVGFVKALSQVTVPLCWKGTPPELAGTTPTVGQPVTLNGLREAIALRAPGFEPVPVEGGDVPFYVAGLQDGTSPAPRGLGAALGASGFLPPPISAARPSVAEDPVALEPTVDATGVLEDVRVPDDLAHLFADDAAPVGSGGGVRDALAVPRPELEAEATPTGETMFDARSRLARLVEGETGIDLADEASLVVPVRRDAPPAPRAHAAPVSAPVAPAPQRVQPPPTAPPPPAAWSDPVAVPGTVGVARPRSTEPERHAGSERHTGPAPAPTRHQCQVVTVWSSKGGVGKTTVAANLAAELRNVTGWEVCVVDLDLGDGNLASRIGAYNAPTIVDILNLTKLTKEAVYDQLATERTSGFMAVLAPKLPQYAQGAQYLSPARYDTLLQVLHQMFDVVILDCPDALTEPLVTQFALPRADSVVAVIDTERAAVIGLRGQLRDLVGPLGVTKDRVGVFLNQQVRRRGLSRAEIERVLEGFPVIGVVSDDRESFTGSANQGQLIVNKSGPVGDATRQAFDQAIAAIFPDAIEDARRLHGTARAVKSPARPERAPKSRADKGGQGESWLVRNSSIYRRLVEKRGES
ncbi:MAG: AAA family ATPase [Acidimicrobiales bacterium]